MRNYYVIRHDFGYGKDVPLSKLNKLLLRNFDDLQEYIKKLVFVSYTSNKQDNLVLCFDNQKYKINIDVIK